MGMLVFFWHILCVFVCVRSNNNGIQSIIISSFLFFFSLMFLAFAPREDMTKSGDAFSSPLSPSLYPSHSVARFF